MNGKFMSGGMADGSWHEPIPQIGYFPYSQEPPEMHQGPADLRPKASPNPSHLDGLMPPTVKVEDSKGWLKQNHWGPRDATRLARAVADTYHGEVLRAAVHAKEQGTRVMISYVAQNKTLLRKEGVTIRARARSRHTAGYRSTPQTTQFKRQHKP